MLFNSLSFLIFFPVVTLLYFIIPKKLRTLWILITSYYFYMGWNPQYALLIAFSTVSTYISGILIAFSRDKAPPEKKSKAGRLWVAISFTVNIGILFFFKYFDFAIDNINALLGATGFSLLNPAFDVLLPVGISFYTFQALSYTVDVYRRDVKVERNLIRYAAFVSFFPQLVAGPIERSPNLLGQFYEDKKFDYDRAKSGILLMFWGFFQKIVVADRVAVLVNQVFDYYPYYGGFEILIGVLFFAVQIYGDFAGYSNIAIGAARVMNFDLMENFRQPYLARSVAEFWRRWHISLSTWFRDYLYIPLGGSRRGTARKYLHVMIVFLVSGLWHGASWTYVVWGGLNGLYQVLGDITLPLRRKIRGFFRLSDQTVGYRVMQMLTTFILINFAWIFFRAGTVGDAFAILRQLVGESNPWVLFDGTLYTLGLDRVEFLLSLFFIACMLVVDIAHYRGISFGRSIARQPLPVRWLLYIAMIYVLLIFGIYGPNFDASQFIYFQF